MIPRAYYNQSGLRYLSVKQCRKNRKIKIIIGAVLIIYIVGFFLINKTTQPVIINEAEITLPSMTLKQTYDQNGNIRYENEKYEVRIK